jgi:hypothetical protein
MLNRLLNPLLNVLSVVCLGVLIWNFVHRPQSAETRTSPKIGSKISIPGVSWKDDYCTVVLAVSTSCPYCRASSGFYESLVKSASGGPFQVMAVIPEPMESARPLLSTIGIATLPNVRQVDYSKIGISATPELFIVGKQGTVEAAWIGSLNAAQEAEVYAKLGVKRPVVKKLEAQKSSETSEDYVAPQQVHTLLADPHTVLVDTRTRPGFERVHIHGALNIPVDEVYGRAIHELPKDAKLLVYCGDLQVSGCPAAQGEAGSGLPTMCAATKTIMHRIGFSDIHLITADMSLLANQRVSVEGTTCK